ncbi:MAG: putative baseplate assembly protein, partial [Blastocatellia bacterium]
PPPSAAAAMTWLPTDPVPQVTELLGVLGQITEVWGPAQKDLLSSAPEKLDFVVEVESDGTAYIRFGDGEYGLRPAPGTTFSASYRVGNGVSGNIGADALAHLVTADKTILAASNPVISIIRNPIPASGGVEPESIEHVRQHAPAAFTTQERAVTADDYAAITERRSDIQRAAATVRWTGSWQTIFVSADRKGAIAVDQPFKSGLTQYLEPFRMAGRDVEIEGPVFVSLDIAITVCVMADYVSADVEGDLLNVFSNRVLPDGSLGFFHPDNFTFGQPVYLSAIYAAAQSVQGVMFVDVARFQRQGVSDKHALLSGVLDIERLEIARLDNDPNFPEHGALSLTMQGGR